jgi:hypothetical protein
VRTAPISSDSLPRRSGVKLDSDRIDYELARRGKTAHEVSLHTGIPESTLSRARHGRAVSGLTLRRLTAGLLEIPLLIGADLLVAEPVHKKTAGASTSPAVTSAEASASGAPTT